MEGLSRDELFLIAIELDLPELLRFCGSSSRINNIICQQDPIWRYRLSRDYPNYRKFTFNTNKSLRSTYNSLYRINQLKQKLGLNLSLLEIYNLKLLEIDGDNDTKISVLPSEIEELVNLQRLWLPNNNLESLPLELSKLTNLEELILDGNSFTKFPSVITKMPQLIFLSIHSNHIKTLPREIGKLVNLTEINLASNKLQTLPLEMTNMNNLTDMVLGDNEDLVIPPEIEQMENLDIMR